MRILYITPSFQHPTMRGPTRCYHFIRELSQRHAITLFSLTKSEVSPAVIKEMGAYAERIVAFGIDESLHLGTAGILGSLPLVGGRIKSILQQRAALKRMKEALGRLLQQESYDVMLFHGKTVFSVIEDCNGLPIVMDFCDATSTRILSNMRYAQLAKIPLLGVSYLRVRRLEKELLKKTPHVAFVSCRDREAVLKPGHSARVIPIGVDCEYWQRKSYPSSSNCVVFTGVMDYGPNEDAAFFLMGRILPLVRRSIPDLKVLIVGRSPSPALVRAGRRHVGVTVTGFVEDIRPYLERATLFVAPLRYGSGMQNKVLEAMAMEVPVVTTSIVADGLRVDEGGDPPVKVADGERQFAECIVGMLGEDKEEQRSRQAAEGRCYVKRHFDWSRSAGMIEQMCEEAVAQCNTKRQGVVGGGLPCPDTLTTGRPQRM